MRHIPYFSPPFSNYWVRNGLKGLGRHSITKVDQNVTKLECVFLDHLVVSSVLSCPSCSLELNSWKSHLPPQLDITPGNRVRSTPQRLMLHCYYWWFSIVLHQPFFNLRAPTLIHHGDPEIDHVKVKKFTHCNCEPCPPHPDLVMQARSGKHP